MAVAQHHDAVTGTNEVIAQTDYTTRLKDGLTANYEVPALSSPSNFALIYIQSISEVLDKLLWASEDIYRDPHLFFNDQSITITNYSMQV